MNFDLSKLTDDEIRTLADTFYDGAHSAWLGGQNALELMFLDALSEVVDEHDARELAFAARRAPTV